MEGFGGGGLAARHHLPVLPQVANWDGPPLLKTLAQKLSHLKKVFDLPPGKDLSLALVSALGPTWLS